MSKEAIWQFHFRNFDQEDQYFSVHHADCGGAPWHENRGRCWHKAIGHNPQGDLDNPFYAPRNYLIKIDQVADVIADSVQEAADIVIAIFTEGEGIDEAIQDILPLADHIDELKEYDIEEILKELEAKSDDLLEQSCSSIHRTTEEIKAIAKKMGLKNFGFIAGDSYQKLIDQNGKFNDFHGWTVMKSHPKQKVKHLANAVFISEGKFIYYYNSYDDGGFWNQL